MAATSLEMTTYTDQQKQRAAVATGGHGISECASGSLRLNTSPHTMHSRTHIGFVERSPLVNIMTNSLPTLSSLILSNLQPIELPPRRCQKPPLRHRNFRWTLSSNGRRSPGCGAGRALWAGHKGCHDLRYAGAEPPPSGQIQRVAMATNVGRNEMCPLRFLQEVQTVLRRAIEGKGRTKEELVGSLTLPSS
jgi:hypothetical protein